MSLCYKILELFEIFFRILQYFKRLSHFKHRYRNFCWYERSGPGASVVVFGGGFVSFADKMTRLCVILVPTWWYIYQADIREIQIYMQKQITFLKKDIFFKYIPLLLFLNFLPSMPHLCFLDVLQHLNCWHVFAEVN